MRQRNLFQKAGAIVGGAAGALFGLVVGLEYGGTMGAITGTVLGIAAGAVIGPYLLLLLAAIAALVVAPLLLVGLVLYVIGLAIEDLLGRKGRDHEV